MLFLLGLAAFSFAVTIPGLLVGRWLLRLEVPVSRLLWRCGMVAITACMLQFATGFFVAADSPPGRAVSGLLALAALPCGVAFAAGGFSWRALGVAGLGYASITVTGTLCWFGLNLYLNATR